MVIDVGTELDLLHLDDLLLFAGFVLLLLLLVLELAEIEQLADRRIGVRRNLDEVEACVFRRAIASRADTIPIISPSGPTKRTCGTLIS